MKRQPSTQSGGGTDDFRQVSDDEVLRLLERTRGRRHAGAQRSAAPVIDPRELSIPVGGGELDGTLAAPAAPIGLVLFAHGSGSSRLSPRNRYVSSVLHRSGLATLLFDLLTRDEGARDEETAELRFDIALLARRLVQATDWVLAAPETKGLPLGYFGASTGAAAALIAAAERPAAIGAIVSRGGRPDLASGSLPRVRAPTLLIVGAKDRQVLELNRRASEQLSARHKLAIVPGATHLFEEPGALDAVARLAGDWFRDYLGRVNREIRTSIADSAATA